MAGRIFVTGDTHGEFWRFSTRYFSLQKELNKEDYVIICGDFGLIWDVTSKELSPEKAESEREKWWLDWLEHLPFTLLFVDGNHENFDRLNRYPVEEWHGGKVHKIRPTVIHLMRGQVFELAGKTFFTFGGARSHDISDGILEADDPKLREKMQRLEKQNALYRVNHISWWKEEMPSKEEMEEGLENLKKHRCEVDYIITHCCSGKIQKRLNESFFKDELNDYFDEVQSNCNYKKWFFGHYHGEKIVSPQDVLLYYSILELGGALDALCNR